MILTDSFKGMVQMYQNPDHEPGKPEETRLIEAMRLAGSNADELAAMVEMLGLIVDSSLLHMTRAEEAQAKANQARELMREDLAAMQKALEDGHTPDALHAYLEGAVKKSLESLPKGQERPARLTMAKLVENMGKEQDGLETGLKALHDKGIRIPRGALTIITARPGCGKTSLMLTLARRMSTGEQALFISYEEAIHRLGGKLGLGYLGKNAPEAEAWHERKLLLSDKPSLLNPQTPEVGAALVETSKAMDRVFFHEGPENSGALVNLIKAEREWIERDGDKLGAVFIDYVQLIPGEGQSYSRQTELAKVSASLRTLARDTGLSIILGAQITRTAETTDHIREADDVLNDANLVLGLSPVVEPVDIDEEHRLAVPIQIDNPKNRDGANGLKAVLPFRGRCYSFTDESDLSDKERKQYENYLRLPKEAKQSGSGKGQPKKDGPAI